jgi:parallel beta-helix repeat protein
MSKRVVLLLVLVFLTASCITAPLPVKAEYSGDITINADGTIKPSIAPILRTGDTFTLTGDVHGSITVIRSSMTFDGNGYSLIYLGPHGVGGLSIKGLSNVTVKNLIVKGSIYGINLVETTNTLIFNNTILETGGVPFQETNGIRVYGGGSNTIKRNNLINNHNGMSFLGTQNNLIVENNIENSTTSSTSRAYGIAFWTGASNNTIYHNSFINNEVQVNPIYSHIPTNTWDDGYPSGGNYWRDYFTKYPNAIEVDNSGIGDTPYVIDAKNTDRYPLMEPYNVASPKISVLSPVNQAFNETSVPLAFTVNKPATWMGYSLDRQDNVTVTGNVTLANLTSGLHNVTVYAEDTFGNEGASETIAFSVALETFPIVPVLVASVATLAIACTVILVYLKRHHGHEITYDDKQPFKKN